MIRLEPAEETAHRPPARFQPHRRVLDGRHRMLVLAAHAGQAFGQARRRPAGPGREAMDLQAHRWRS